MAQPTTRTEFKEWCLRKLGKPVIQINVDDAQIEDRIDEALSMYWDYHYSGTEKTYLKHQITQADIDNRYITIPENVIGVTKIFDLSGLTSFGGGTFSPRHQFALNAMRDFTSYNLSDYTIAMDYLALIEEVLVGQQPIRYNRHINRLYIDTDWDSLTIGNYIVADCHRVVDPDTYSDVWKDRWLQNYATALIKIQWGDNLTKYEGVQLIGGVQFNGDKIYSEGKEERDKLEEFVQANGLPVDWVIG